MISFGAVRLQEHKETSPPQGCKHEQVQYIFENIIDQEVQKIVHGEYPLAGDLCDDNGIRCHRSDERRSSFCLSKTHLQSFSQFDNHLLPVLECHDNTNVS